MNVENVESYVTTNGMSDRASWRQAPIWDLRSDFFFCQTVAVSLTWGALSDEKTGLDFYNVQYRIVRIHGNSFGTKACLLKRSLLSSRGSIVACVTTGILCLAPCYLVATRSLLSVVA
jgi:hypothetical protein